MRECITVFKTRCFRNVNVFHFINILITLVIDISYLFTYYVYKAVSLKQ